MPGLFVYGTLMDPALVRALTGREFPGAQAILRDFRRVEVAGHYPYIEAHSGSEVTGVLLSDIDAEALAILDRYEDEGSMYLRRPVSVRVGGDLHDCETYIGVPSVILAVERKAEDELVASRQAR